MSTGQTSIEFLFLSVAALQAAQYLRAVRLTSLFPKELDLWPFHLLVGTSLGALTNAFLPLPSGEVIRIAYIARRCRLSYSHTLAVVLAERLSDCVILALFAFAIAFTSPQQAALAQCVALISLSAALLLAVSAFLIKKSSASRAILWTIASVFNNQISHAILDCAWSFADIVYSRVMLRRRYLLTTIPMWTAYTVAFALYCHAVSTDLPGLFFDLLASTFRLKADHFSRALPTLFGPHMLFVLLPVLMLFIYSAVRDRTRFFHNITSGVRGSYGSMGENARRVGNRYKNATEYESFLNSLFGQGDGMVTGFGVSDIEDGVVHKLFKGGSGAITAVVEVKDGLRIRKFATGSAKDKLREQAQWLKQYRDRLPLVDIIAQRDERTFYRYDMPYLPTARDFYDVIHIDPLQNSTQYLQQVVERIAVFHQKTAVTVADDFTIESYLDQKARQNAQVALAFARELLENDEYILNGKPYNLNDWDRLVDIAWLRKQVTARNMSVIHGDLTIENIIINPGSDIGWYLIDPNPANVFNTGLIDWAKLMQSLHLGYENLNKGGVAAWEHKSLSLPIARSHNYNELHSFYEKLLSNLFGSDAIREVSFHELINYLRLVPYKIRQNPAKGLTFFTCTSILLREYIEKYD